ADAVARELRRAVRLADVFLRSAVLVDGGDVQIRVRVARLVLEHGARDVDGLRCIEMRREAVVRGHAAAHGHECRERDYPPNHLSPLVHTRAIQSEESLNGLQPRSYEPPGHGPAGTKP